MDHRSGSWIGIISHDQAFGPFFIIIDHVYSGKYPPSDVADPFYEEFKDAPTIFVGAAHCNYICKDMTNPDRPVAVETCCCRESSTLTSCRKGSKVRIMICFTSFLGPPTNQPLLSSQGSNVTVSLKPALNLIFSCPERIELLPREGSVDRSKPRRPTDCL